MADPITLSVQKREGAGRGPARAVRRQGRVPGIIYGQGKETVLVSVDPRELTRELHKPGFFARLLNVESGGETVRALPREVQLDPVTDRPVHVDFMRVGAGTKIKVAVPVHFLNMESAPGIRRGGILNVVRHEIELLCPADNIPAQIDIDIAGLEIGDSVHMRQVKLPEGVKPTLSRDFTVASVTSPTAVREEAAAAAAAAAAAEAAAAAAAEAGTVEGAVAAGAAPGAAPAATAPSTVPASAAAAAAASAAAAAAAAAAASSRTAVGEVTDATVKSRLKVGLTPSGSLTCRIWTLSPISRPAMSMSICAGMLSAGHSSSISWRTTLRMPPRRMPGALSMLRKCTGTATLILVPAPTRMKSTCTGRSVTGSSCTSRGRARTVSPPDSTLSRRAKNPGLCNSRVSSRGSTLTSTVSLPWP